MPYDVFISYSHAGDELLSERVQDGLARFAKPWWRRRALKVFRDRTGLAANPGLWSSIAAAIDDSRYFLILASPEAAASPWCQREVDRWRAAHGTEGILLLLTAGKIAWDDDKIEFDWSRTNALNAAFAGCFREEPRYVDMRWARSELQLDLSDGRFSDQIAELAAPVHGVAKDQLIGADVRQHRRTIRHAIAAATALIIMTAASIATTVYAFSAAASARRNATRAEVAETADFRQTGIANTDSKRANAAQTAEQAKELEAQTLRGRAQHLEKVATSRATEVRHTNTKLQRVNGRLNRTNLALDVSNTRLNGALGVVKVANSNLSASNRALTSSELASAARLAARRGEQLIDAGDQTYQLGLLLTAESLRHSCASGAVARAGRVAPLDPYPDAACRGSSAVDPSVLASARLALSSGGGRQFAIAQLAGTAPVDLSAQGGSSNAPDLFDPIAWAADGQRFSTLSSGQTGSAAVAQVWDRNGKLVADVTGATGMTPEEALSGDGNTFAVTAISPRGTDVVSAWSLVTGRRILADIPGRRPALSTNGAAIAWLADNHSSQIELSTPTRSLRSIQVPAPPAGVAVSPDGRIAVALLAQGGNNYSIAPILTATGKRGSSVSVGDFAVPIGDSWANPPQMFGSVDPPMITFANDDTVWIYNNERHVAARLVGTSARPAVLRTETHTITANQTFLRAATPSGSELADEYDDNAGHSIVAVGGITSSVQDIAALSLCASNPCQFNLSPDGTLLLVRSLSVLQLLDLSAPTSAKTALASNDAQGSGSILISPSGGSAIHWDARDIFRIDAKDRTRLRVSVPLSSREQIQTINFSPSGGSYAVLISRGAHCPCRVAIVAALGTQPIDEIRLRGQMPDTFNAASIAPDDADDRLALAVDASAAGRPGTRRCALMVFDVATGQQLLERDNGQVGLGCDTLSTPAFAPHSHNVALVATGEGTGNVAGVVINADTGELVHRLTLAPGATTSQDGGSHGYALRFSPNGNFVAWNSGGSVVVWTVNGPRLTLASQTVLAYSAPLDPQAVAVSNSGSVAAVGQRIYSTSILRNFDSLLTADALGRFFEPLGGGSVVGNAATGQMSVAIDSAGVISTATVDAGTSEIRIDQVSASPQSVLAALCAEASGTLTRAQWTLYFPGEPYVPACKVSAATPVLQMRDEAPTNSQQRSIRRVVPVPTSQISARRDLAPFGNAASSSLSHRSATRICLEPSARRRSFHSRAQASALVAASRT